MQDRQVPLDLFVGRTAELARVSEVVTRVEAGQPWLVAIEGDPGVGKTSLARRCLTQAPSLKVLSARGDQAETDLDFGLVDQLFRVAGDAFPAVLPVAGTGPPQGRHGAFYALARPTSLPPTAIPQIAAFRICSAKNQNQLHFIVMPL